MEVEQKAGKHGIRETGKQIAKEASKKGGEVEKWENRKAGKHSREAEKHGSWEVGKRGGKEVGKQGREEA